MNSANIITGNICSLLAMGTDALSSGQKTAKRVLWIQNLSQLIYFIGTVALKGYSGAVQNVVSILRNLAAIKGIKSKAIEYLFIVSGVVLGLVFNHIGWTGLLPVLANLQYSLAVFRFKDNEQALKASFLICVLLFSVFNWTIMNYVGMCSNLIVAVATTVFLLKARFQAKNG